MTPTEKGRRVDALNQGPDTRRVLCEMVANREGDIDDLREENARLREQSERLFDKTLELATENSKLRELCKLCEREAENAKLRELFNETLIRLAAANEAAGGGFMDARYCELLESHGIEVGE